MRSFIISLLILFLCICICFINSTLIRQRIMETLDQLSSLTPEDATGFSEKWKSTEHLFSITVKRSYMRDIADSVRHMVSSANEGDTEEFEVARADLIYKMKELFVFQSFSFNSIL